MLRVDGDERSWWLHLLDAPTSAPLWPHSIIKDKLTLDRLSDDDYRWTDHFEVRFDLKFMYKEKCHDYFIDSGTFTIR